MANIDLEKLTLLYEGKAKQVYATDNKDEYIVHYKDDATAFNGEKHDTILGKGVLNNKISQFEDNTDSEKQNGNQHTRQDKIDHLFRNLPKNGFLSISLVGDLALIERHRRAVKNLQQNEGCYAPYLSSYLFDIENANRPDEIPEITEWENKSLNDKQKSAVQKMLAAPDICLIQGPPGTGKTTVIAEACLQFTKGLDIIEIAEKLAELNYV